MFHRKKRRSCEGRAWIELDRAALRHNVAALCALLPGGCQLVPVVKANAYGHGAALVARELNALGIRAFCVACVTEGMALRKAGIEGKILILGYTHPAQFDALRRYHLTQTVVDAAHAHALNACGKKLCVQIKIDTGMRRLGERSERLDEISKIFGYGNLKVEGAFTHLCADDTVAPEDRAFTLAQARAFQDAVAGLKERGCVCPKTHLLASYGFLHYPELGGDWERVGIALYGVLSTRADTENCPVDLRPVLSLKARVALVKDLYQGEAAGYGLQFTAQRDMKIAVLAIGYADGLPRSLSCGVGRVLLHGEEAPVIGRICMDQTLVDVSDIPGISPGDVAVAVGKSGDREISVCDIAEQTGTISNEILSRLGERLEREIV